MKTKSAIILLSAILVLGGCQTTQEKKGHVLGSVLGGVLGSRIGKGSGRIVGAVIGTVIGGFVGGEIGRTMDENDRYRANGALETAPTNEQTSWHNPDSGNDYKVTPTKTYTENSKPCREYTTEAWIGGKKETLYGTACRQADGSWQTKA